MTGFWRDFFTTHQPTPDGSCTCRRPGMTAPWPDHMAALIETIWHNQLVTREAP